MGRLPAMEAYQKALEAFHEKYPSITVSPPTAHGPAGRRSSPPRWLPIRVLTSCGSTGTGCTSTAPTGEKFVDLREYSDVIDLSQWSDTAKNACTVADSLQAVPISMTGRIFYWNMNTFQAGRY